MAPSLQVHITPPRFCDFLEELVVGNGVKTLGLDLCATCRGVVLLIFGSVYFRSYILCIPTVSSFQDNIIIIEVRVGLCAERMYCN